MSVYLYVYTYRKRQMFAMFYLKNGSSPILKDYTYIYTFLSHYFF